MAPNVIGKADKSVKVVNNYEPLTTKNEDSSIKFVKSEFPSRGDSLKHKNSQVFNRDK